MEPDIKTETEQDQPWKIVLGELTRKADQRA